MYIKELQALFNKVGALKDNQTTVEVCIFVSDAVAGANAPSMAQRVCSQVITMCHPRAWGDMYVEGFDETGWMNYLGEISETANTCVQLVYENRLRDKGLNC